MLWDGNGCVCMASSPLECKLHCSWFCLSDRSPPAPAALASAQDKPRLCQVPPGIPRIHAWAEPSSTGICRIVSTLPSCNRAALDPGHHLEPRICFPLFIKHFYSTSCVPDTVSKSIKTINSFNTLWELGLSSETTVLSSLKNEDNSQLTGLGDNN